MKYAREPVDYDELARRRELERVALKARREETKLATSILRVNLFADHEEAWLIDYALAELARDAQQFHRLDTGNSGALLKAQEVVDAVIKHVADAAIKETDL